MQIIQLMQAKNLNRYVFKVDIQMTNVWINVKHRKSLMKCKPRPYLVKMAIIKKKRDNKHLQRFRENGNWNLHILL